MADSLATYKHLRHVVVVDAIPRLPSGKVLRRTLRDEWTPAARRRRRGALMDVRLSPEQQALRDSAAQVVDRLGPKAVGQLDDAERAAKLDAAVGRGGLARAAGRPTTTARRWPRGSRRRSSPRSSAAGLADVAFLGPTLAAELRRLAGAPAGDRARDRRAGADLAGWPSPRDGTAPDGAVAIDADGRRVGPRARPDGGGYALGQVGAGAGRGAHRPHPTDRRRRPRAAGPGRRRRGPLTADDLAAWTALGLALTCADLVGTMRGAVDLAVDYANGAPPVRRGRSARSRPCSTCSPTPSSLMEGSRSVALHAAWAVDALAADDALGRRRGGQGLLRPGRPHRVRDRDPGARRHRQHVGVPRPRATCAGRCCRATCSAAPAPASTACSPTTGSEVDRGLR